MKMITKRNIHLKQHAFCLVLSTYAMYMYTQNRIRGFNNIRNNTAFFSVSPLHFKGIDTQKDSVENIEISLSCDYKNLVNSLNMCIIKKISKFVMIETCMKKLDIHSRKINSTEK